MVLELFYYTRELRDEDLGVSRRKARGLLLLKKFAGDWKSKHIVFWDPEDEFPSRQAVIEEIRLAYRTVRHCFCIVVGET